jgi:hypothetical protein
MRTQANVIKFAHQSLCNPKISTLLRAVRKGFLKGCPNMTERLNLKYLNPSPATAKGHMKCPHHGIRSTRPKMTTSIQVPPFPVAQIAPLVLPLLDAVLVYPGLAYGARLEPNIIATDGDESINNIFCFGAFTNKNSGIVYHNLTGLFLFMYYDGSVCFFVLYHYESNAILVTPIAGLDNMSVFNAYKTYFDDLMAKGFKQKLKTMDNQATW